MVDEDAIFQLLSKHKATLGIEPKTDKIINERKACIDKAITPYTTHSRRPIRGYGTGLIGRALSGFQIDIGDKNIITIGIGDLKTKKLTSLKGTLSDAVANRKLVNIHVNSKEPEEILKATYVAGTLSKRGYSCAAQILKDRDEIDWTCEPPE